jgi:hypothetical protein
MVSTAYCWQTPVFIRDAVSKVFIGRDLPGLQNIVGKPEDVALLFNES